MKKRITALLLAALFVAALASCNTPGTPTEQTPWNPVGEPNEFGWIRPEETLRITVFGGENDPVRRAEDLKGGLAYMNAWLLEHMNVVIEWEVYAQNVTERLNLMLADGSYPEVLIAVPDDMANRFAAQGRAVDLSPYLESHLPNMTRRVGDYMNMLRTDDGKLYKLPSGWGDNPNVPGHDFGIRYDLWLELGVDEIYTTPEEYYETLKAILANHPTNADGQKTYAFTATNWSGDQGTFMLRAFLAAYGFNHDGPGAGVQYLHNKEDGSFRHWLRTDEGREISLLMNRMWREGMIDPDYLSTTYDDYISKLATHRVIGNLGTWWYAWVGGHEIWSVENPDYQIEQRFMNVSITGPGVPYEETRLLTQNFLGNRGDRVIITDKCNQIEAVLAFIDWQASELGNMITGWGPPVETNNWWIDENGMWVVSDDIIDNVSQKNIYFHDTRERHGANTHNIGGNVNWLRCDGRSVFDRIDPRVTRVSIFDYWPVDPETGEFTDPGTRISWGNYKAPAFDTILYNTSFDPEARVTQIRATMIDMLPVWWANIMTADSEEACLRAIDDSLAAAENLGLAVLEQFYKDNYEANYAKMFGN
ncbi:MAG: extracellular solute-binding protein [Defluviitaleaceae bacterium]|nr:extracellular solute-binding protein [Defluviitaleaceae bacterium]MCL2835925.1 extracellular solute-binding protein [Defluviitaleaceae bacterium]